MGTKTGTNLIDTVARMLFDVNNVKWGREEMLLYVNNGVREIVSVLPEASATTTTMQLAAGCRQTIPAGSWMLLDVIRNMGTTGTDPGRAIQRVDMLVFDESNPAWQSDTASTTTTVYMYNARERGSFYVYPQPDNLDLHYIELIHSVYPTEQAEGSAIIIDDVYAPMLINYMLWRAHSKQANYADPNKAAQYFTLFSNAIQANGTSIAKLVSEQGRMELPTTQGQGSAVVPPVTN